MEVPGEVWDDVNAKAEAVLERLERLEKLVGAVEAADDLLLRLSRWDVLNLAPGSGDDGPYWQHEIARVRGLLGEGE